MTQSNALSAAAEAELQDILRRYPNKMAAIVPVLHLCQRERATDGWFVTPELEAFVADRLDMPLAKVREVISFYTMFNKRPVGRYHLQLCSTLSCALAGSDRIYEHLCDRLGIAKGETTPDGMFTLSRVECLGSCGTAPCIQVNYEEFEENLNEDRTDALLERLRKRG